MMRFQHRPLLLLTLLLLFSCSNLLSTPSDGGEPPSPDGSGSDSASAEARQNKCGAGTCPSKEYTCCQLEKNAPPECCLKGYASCYKGGGTFTGWPVYNGCNPQKCKAPQSKHCKGSTRNTCCRPQEECGSSWGVAYCKNPSCPKDRQCNSGKLCCSQKGICLKFLNIEYCAEECAKQGKEKCSLTGRHYGTQPFFLCCPKGKCRNHPDGWPFCEGEVT